MDTGDASLEQGTRGSMGEEREQMEYFQQTFIFLKKQDFSKIKQLDTGVAF